MSYILNALRKSEQERQAREDPTLENRVLCQQEIHKPWKTWLVISLIAINLAMLSFFFWQSRQKPVSSLPVESAVKAQAEPSIPPESGKLRKNSPSENRNETIDLPARKTTGKIESSISESVEKRKSLAIKPVQKPTLEEKVATLVDVTGEEGLTVLKRSAKKEDTLQTADLVNQGSAEQKLPSEKSKGKDTFAEVTEKTKLQQASSNKISSDIESEEVDVPSNSKKGRENNDQNLSSPAEISAEAFESAGKRKAAPSPKRDVKKTAKPNIPYIDDLPVDFRRKFPDLNINVYVFSEDPDESFIMVDMVKFVPGQNITEGLELKDIRHESMVVEFEGKKVRIRRP